MESLLKNIIPTALYLKWFNPSEDTQNGNNVYLHILDENNNTTFSLKFKKGVTRYDVVAFLKDLHDNTIEDDEVVHKEFGCLFEFYSQEEFKKALKLLNIFTKDKYIFLGESNINVIHEQDEENKLWYTHFNKTNNIKNQEHTKCIACICNKYTYVFDN